MGPTLNPHTTHGCHWVIRKLRCFFPATKGRDISEFDQVTTVTKVDSVLSVNRWQYPNHLAQFTRLLPYLHCRLNVNLHRIVIITKKPQTTDAIFFEVKFICHFTNTAGRELKLSLPGWQTTNAADNRTRLISNSSSDRKQISSNSRRLILALITNASLFPHTCHVSVFI